jgi:xanthine dehydrogenase molybdenum-binding subunit
MNMADQVSKLFEASKIRNIRLHAQYPLINTGQRQCTKHGAPACLVHYVVINLVADALGMDPTEVALKNDGCEGHDINWIYENIAKKQGFNITRWSLKECIEIGKKLIGWNGKWHRPGEKILPNGKYHGLAFGYTMSWNHRANEGVRYALESDPLPRVHISLCSDGSVRVITYRADTGVGADTSYSMILADEIGIRLEQVHIDIFPMKEFRLSPMAGSMGTAVNTPLLVYAARKMKRRILEEVVKQIDQFKGKAPEELDIKNGVIFEKAHPENRMSISDAAFTLGAGLSVEASIKELFEEQKPPLEQPCMVRQVTLVEVEVDPDTGQVDVMHVVRVYDCGKVINLGAVRGQLYPHWGIGRGLTEALYHDPLTGIWLNDDFVQYPILLMNDIKKIDVEFVETGVAYGAYGSCGCSEAGAAAPTPIIPLAVYSAIGKWIEDWPATPDRILKALGKA